MSEPIQIGAENFMHRLWHRNCPKWMPESRHGRNTSAIMRYVKPSVIQPHDDGSPLYLAECLHCGARGFIGLDKLRRVIVRDELSKAEPLDGPHNPSPTADTGRPNDIVIEPGRATA